MSYPTLDYLPDLTGSEMTFARPISLASYINILTQYSSNWDNAGHFYSGTLGSTPLPSVFRWNGSKGATYDISSSSFFSPNGIFIYDNKGNLVTTGTDSSIYGTDFLSKFIAPYTGTFYVTPGWWQGLASNHKDVSLSIYEDNDTAAYDDFADSLADYISPLGALIVGEIMTGNIELPNDQDRFLIALKADVPYVFSLTGAAGGGGTLGKGLLHSSCLKLYGSIDNLLASASFGGAGGDPLMLFTPTSSGIYYLSVSNLFGDYIPNTGTYTLKANSSDVTAPIISTFQAPFSVNGNIVITFNEAVQCGTGYIVLKDADGSTIETFDVSTSSRISISSSKLTIDPTLSLRYSTSYKVEFTTGSVQDIAGNTLLGTATNKFSTTKAPDGIGTIGNDKLNGTSGNDELNGLAGDDFIDGGSGNDIAKFSENSTAYAVNKTSSGWTVSSAVEGVDTLSNIERIKFADKTIALDINGNAGQAYRIYQATFDRKPDNGGLKYWISNMDNGSSLDQVASGFIASAEFQNLYGTNPTADQFVTKLYANVLHRVGETTGHDYWVNGITSGAISKTQALVGFSESNENQVAVIGVIQNGIELV